MARFGQGLDAGRRVTTAEMSQLRGLAAVPPDHSRGGAGCEHSAARRAAAAAGDSADSSWKQWSPQNDRGRLLSCLGSAAGRIRLVHTRASVQRTLPDDKIASAPESNRRPPCRGSAGPTAVPLLTPVPTRLNATRCRPNMPPHPDAKGTLPHRRPPRRTRWGLRFRRGDGPDASAPRVAR